MARFAFLTFYDKICLGPRILSSTVKSAGHSSKIILFKDEAFNYVFFKKKKPRVNYECYINGFIKGMHYDVDPWTSKEVSHLTSLLSKLNPDVLCISTRSFWTYLGKSLVESIREVLPNVPIVAGGWGPSLEAEEYLRYCDYVCFGEGEDVILDIGTAIDQGKNFRNIKNLIFKNGDRIIRNSAREPIKAMDKVALPDFSLDDVYLINNDEIVTGHDFYNEKIYDIFLGRGCPMTCSYCMSGKWSKLYKDNHGLRYPKVRMRSPERCIQELEFAKARGAIFFRFKDEVFPYHRKWVDQFLKLYKDRINLPFFAYLAAEFHKPEMIDKLYAAGLKTCGLGIQSASEDILKNIYHRPSIGQKFNQLAEIIEEKKIETSYDVIAHNPFETSSDMEKTFHFLASLPLAEIQVFKLGFFPEAPISKKMEKLKPIPESEKTYRWYSILYCMCGKSNLMRSLAVFIEKYRLFKKMPQIIQLLFIPHVVKEKVREMLAKKKYRVKSMTLPGVLKKTATNH